VADDGNKAGLEPRSPEFSLWSDDPAEVDLLSFSAIASTIVEALLDDELDPLAVGLSGSWGSGKTTVLRLIQQELLSTTTDEKRVLVVPTDPWRYDPSTGVKETLIAEVLRSLKRHLEASQDTKSEALAVLKKLAKRVDWARAIRIAAKGALAFQVPSFDDVVQIVRPEEGEAAPGLDAFREEFQEFMDSDALADVRRVVVLVDDLDRCLPETVIDTLEAIRLFLAVPKMSFVIAADEERVADAIRTRLGGDTSTSRDQPEEAAKLYLHKIVQTTVPIPALSRFDTESFLILLQILTRLDGEQRTACIDRCAELRRTSGELDELAQSAGQDISKELLFAARLTPILYEKLRGNPRRIKRFLNDLNVRQAIAARRGIKLDPEIIAKLMVLEVLLPEAFGQVLDWLARNELRTQMSALEVAAGRNIPIGGKSNGRGSKAKKSGVKEESDDAVGGFDDDLLRWAKLPPPLAGTDLGPYLHLAAAFTGRALLDEGLPARLRDLAANLVSSVRAEQKSVTKTDLVALSQADALALIQHLGRVARDRPTEQVAAVLGLLRISRLHQSVQAEAPKVLESIPGDEVQPATPLRFEAADLPLFQGVLERWLKDAHTPTKNAIKAVLPTAASS
jgi:hypothetical protein